MGAATARVSKTAESESPATAEVAIDRIVPSATNPRKSFDDAKLQELAASIKQHGVLEPLLVRAQTTTRPVKLTAKITVAEKSGTGNYELIAGERRLRAAKLAGLKTVPVRVLTLDDMAADEVRVVENLQRADLSPVEEGDGFAALVARHGYTVDKLSTKLGRSKSYVRDKLKLGNLPPSAREAVAAGKMLESVAVLIGRLPSPSMREEATGKLLDRPPWANEGSEPALHFKEAKQSIINLYTVELKGAPFSQTDAKLVPAAGSCKDCPKRAGNNREEYPEARADICTDPECYRAKCAAMRRQTEAQAIKQGLRVLTDEQAKEAFRYGQNRVSFDSNWADLDAECHRAEADKKGQRPTWRAALDGKLTGKLAEVLAHAPDGRSFWLVPKREAEAALKPPAPVGSPQSAGGSKQGTAPPPPANGTLPTDSDDEDDGCDPAAGKLAGTRMKSDREVVDIAARNAGQVLYSQMRSNADGLEWQTILGPSGTNTAWEALRLLAGAAAESANDTGTVEHLADGVLTLMDHLGEGDGKGMMSSFRHWIDRAEPAQLVGLLLKAAVLDTFSSYSGFMLQTKEALLEWGELDWPEILQEAKAPDQGKAALAARCGEGKQPAPRGKTGKKAKAGGNGHAAGKMVPA